jgi:glycosyltransferase involved in cell wall biosynthesis
MNDTREYPADQASGVVAEGVSVVIPCLNEVESIEQVIRNARQGLAPLNLPYEIIVVDNGSTDGSAVRARAAGATVIEEPRRGYGAALRSGFRAAHYSILVMADGDLTYDLKKAETLIRPILDGDADFVLGNRLNGVHSKAMPFLHQHVGNPLLTRLTCLMFHRTDIKDAHSGFRAIRRDRYVQLGCITTGMEFASEMIIRAIYEGLRIAYRDIEYHPRTGESKLRTFRDGWRHLRFLLLHSPSMVFVFPGLLIWTMTLSFAIVLAAGPVIISSRQVDIHSMLVIGVMNIVSMQLMSIGMLAKAYAHLSGIRHDPVIAWLYRHLSFEAGGLLSGGLVCAGIMVVGLVFGNWTSRGFGEINLARPLFFGVLCAVNGVQLGASAYLFSIMALPRRMDDIAPEDSATAIRDIP